MKRDFFRLLGPRKRASMTGLLRARQRKSAFFLAALALISSQWACGSSKAVPEAQVRDHGDPTFIETGERPDTGAGGGASAGATNGAEKDQHAVHRGPLDFRG